MNYVIFDLEWNGCFSKKLNSHINEIIEIGAVKLNDNMEIIGKFSCLIRPVLSTRLSSSVKTLTSLTFDELKKGVPFDYGYNKFRKFADGCVLMTWSTTDIDTLVANLAFHKKINTIPFMKHYADLQLYCHDMLGLSGKNALGLQSAEELLDLDTSDIPHHRALGDSIVTAMCFQKLYHPGAIKTYIQDSTKQEFYDQIFFHSYVIEDPDDLSFSLENIFFCCPECGTRCRQNGDFEPKLKGFSTDFICGRCGFAFIGRVQVRKKYDSVNISKKVIHFHNDAHTSH